MNFILKTILFLTILPSWLFGESINDPSVKAFIELNEVLTRGDLRNPNIQIELQRYLETGVASEPVSLVPAIPIIAEKGEKEFEALKTIFEKDLKNSPIFLKCSVYIILTISDKDCDTSANKEEFYIEDGKFSHFFYHRDRADKQLERLEYILAADSLTQAKEIISEFPQIPIIEVNLLIRQAIVFTEMDPIKGLEYHESALDLAIKTDLKTLQIAQYFNLTKTISDAFYSYDNFPQEIQKRLDPWRNKLPDLIKNTIKSTEGTEFEPYGLAAVALYQHTVKGMHKECVTNFTTSYKQFLDAGNKVWAADALRNMAECQNHIGESKEADASIKHSLLLLQESIENLSDSDKYNYGLVKSQILYSLKNYREAYKILDDTFKLREKSNAKARLSQFSQQSAMLGLAEAERKQVALQKEVDLQEIELQKSRVIWNFTIGLSVLAMILLLLLWVTWWSRRRINTQNIQIKNQATIIDETNLHLKSIMDNIQEAIFKILGDGTIDSSYSMKANGIFDIPIHTLDYKDIFKQILSTSDDETAKILETIGLSLDSDPLSWELNRDHLPNEILYKGKYFSLSWQAVPIKNKVDHILVVVRDISFLKSLEDDQRRAQSRVDLALTLAKEFYSNNPSKSLEIIREIITTVHNPEDDIRLKMHTCKGLSRAMGLRTLSQHIHSWEQNYPQFPDESNKILLEQTNLYINYLGLDKVSVPVSSHFVGDIIIDCYHGILGRLHDLGISLGKQNISITGVYTGRDFDILKLFLIHGINNAVEHGYARKKEEDDSFNDPFCLSIVINQDEYQNSIRITDEGVGLNWKFIDTLEDKVSWERKEGESKANILFHSSQSSTKSVNEFSGRGVGLAAVYHSIRAIDGMVNIEDNNEKGTTISCEWPRQAQKSSRAG